MRLALLAMLLVACERAARPASGDSAAGTQLPPPRTDSQLVVRTSELRIPIREDVAARAKPECSPTGQWAECSVFERLDRAGLAPRRDSAGATEAPLAPRGSLLRIGNSELELYFYPDASARERDEAQLDKTKYLEYPAPLTMRREPTLIRSTNLIAILHSRNEHQRERVSDAITAGPPQPKRP